MESLIIVYSEINVTINYSAGAICIYIKKKPLPVKLFFPVFTQKFLAVIQSFKLFFSPEIPPGLGSGAGWTGQYLTAFSGHRPCFYS